MATGESARRVRQQQRNRTQTAASGRSRLPQLRAHRCTNASLAHQPTRELTNHRLDQLIQGLFGPVVVLLQHDRDDH